MHRQRGVFLSVHVDNIKMGGKTCDQKLIWERWMTQKDPQEQTYVMDQVCLGCMQRECEPNQDIIGGYKNFFESFISSGTIKDLPFWVTSHEKVTPKCCDMKGHAGKFVEKLSEANIFRLHTCVDDHQFKNENLLETVGHFLLCSHIVLKCLNLARIGRLDTFWSLYGLSRATTKWNKAGDKCLARLSSGINCTGGYRQYCHVGNTASP